MHQVMHAHVHTPSMLDFLLIRKQCPQYELSSLHVIVLIQLQQRVVI